MTDSWLVDWFEDAFQDWDDPGLTDADIAIGVWSAPPLVLA
ncbi:MAG: hypothetical protein ACR2N7_01110 [Acidimicrobiia bacterium]